MKAYFNEEEGGFEEYEGGWVHILFYIRLDERLPHFKNNTGRGMS